MKNKIILLFTCLIIVTHSKSQSISPVETGEFCPLQNISFTITLPRIADNTVP